MSQTVTWNAGDVTLVFDYDDNDFVAMRSARMGQSEAVFEQRIPIVDVLTAGTGHRIACNKLTHTVIGSALRYRAHTATTDEHGWHTLTIALTDSTHHLDVVVHYQVADSAPMVRTWADVTNSGHEQPVILDSVTSWTSEFGTPAGQQSDLGAWQLRESRFDWLAEGRWHSNTVRDLLPKFSQEITAVDSRQEYAKISTGTWSTGMAAPLGILESQRLGLTWLFQIEHNGAWRWEIHDDTADGGVALSGPTSENHGWEKVLQPGETFTSVPASFALAGTFEEAVGALTKYRRAFRLPHRDNARPSVVFNDYMNTIYGDPTTAKELPLIKAAAEVGIQIFVIDCGWYDDTGNWWPSVGEWLPSKKRFPNGITEVIDAIRAEGMIPGIWIEPEVIGVQSPMADRLPDSAFFQRHGQRVVEQDRYLLDLRDDAARAHLDSVVDRLVNEYGIGYFKFDYNVSPGAGTDYQADSDGDGLLGHNRAYSAWIDSLYRRYPDLIIENCSSGGMREDFAQLSRFQVQSTSDQQDWKLYPAIAAAAPMMMLPEQAASWAYPQSDMDAETTAFNINTTFLGRFFLSGYLNRMGEAQHTLVESGITAYKEHVQPVIGESTPFWPLGLPEWNDEIVSLGLKTAQGSALVTLWDRGSSCSHSTLQLPQFQGHDVSVTPVFPTQADGFEDWATVWNATDGTLLVDVPVGKYASRTFAVSAR
ncbi:alpha-galactosidase [Bifidobacterium cebidarum]|uniref:Alpha-galactosidase n=2 Tax=Bifidobacterium cebidarum TaxID=2650773 RepID=A0A6I1GCZ8_9BIFI|nr:alpha-galactosidase [Bifidobacterium cebidarum]